MERVQCMADAIQRQAIRMDQWFTKVNGILYTTLSGHLQLFLAEWSVRELLKKRIYLYVICSNGFPYVQEAQILNLHGAH